MLPPRDAALAVPPWEQVLADVEADVRRTEDLLDERAGDHLPTRLGPAALQLPLAAPTLPPIETMPAVPPELADRITQLRLRMIALQAQLGAELAALRDAAVRVASVPVPAPLVVEPATLIDSLL